MHNLFNIQEIIHTNNLYYKDYNIILKNYKYNIYSIILQNIKNNKETIEIRTHPNIDIISSIICYINYNMSNYNDIYPAYISYTTNNDIQATYYYINGNYIGDNITKFTTYIYTNLNRYNDIYIKLLKQTSTTMFD